MYFEVFSHVYTPCLVLIIIYSEHNRTAMLGPFGIDFFYIYTPSAPVLLDTGTRVIINGSTSEKCLYLVCTVFDTVFDTSTVFETLAGVKKEKKKSTSERKSAWLVLIFVVSAELYI